LFKAFENVSNFSSGEVAILVELAFKNGLAVVNFGAFQDFGSGLNLILEGSPPHSSLGWWSALRVCPVSWFIPSMCVWIDR